MLDFLLGFLPGALETVVKYGILLLATGVVLALLVRRFSSRRSLFVRTFGRPAGDAEFDGKTMADRVRRELETIWRAHRGRALSAAGEANKLTDPRRAGEHLGSRAVQFLAGNSPVGFLVGLSSKLWPSVELEGEVVVGDRDPFLWGVRLKRGKEYYHAWQVPVTEDPEGVGRAARELAHRIALDTARLGVFEGDGARGARSASAGTRNWRAFQALTEAMMLWNDPDYDPTDRSKVEAVDAKLAEAIEHDPGYALALYNRGTLHLTTFANAAANERALGYFEQALREAQAQARDAAREKVFVDRRVEGMAYLGIARACSQARHRYGRLDPALVDRAREAAQEAASLLDDSHEALYALAFAWHCTETLEDIREGRKVYERIVAEAPRRYPAVHNNLGYILMKGGEHLMRQGKRKAAEEWWKEAEDQMRTTVKMEGGRMGRWEFAHANLGNLYRLQGRYAESEKEYLRALGPEPEASPYTNGLNELARLYLDWAAASGEESFREKAQRFHERALASTPDEAHRAKLRAEFEGQSPP